MATRTMRKTLEIDAEFAIDDFDLDDLIEAVEECGCIVFRPGQGIGINGLNDVIERRHAEQHRGTIRTCTDEICDAYDRLAGE